MIENRISEINSEIKDLLTLIRSHEENLARGTTNPKERDETRTKIRQCESRIDKLRKEKVHIAQTSLFVFDKVEVRTADLFNPSTL